MLRNLLIFLFLAIMCISAQSQGIFSKITFKNAVKHADTSQKFVFVFGMTSWCDRCNKMQDETLADTAIIEFLNANYISLEVDLESDIGIDFSIKYRASPAPQYLFF